LVDKQVDKTPRGPLRTLYNWSRKHQVDINNMRAIRDERHTRELGLSRCHCRETLGQAHALAKLLDDLQVRQAGNLGLIRLFNAIPRVRQPLGQETVVGNQDQPLAGKIQPADGKQPLTPLRQ
jgi:hypothetical protein